MKLGVKKLDPRACIPTQKLGDIGWDLRAVENTVLYHGCVTQVKTGIALAQWPCEIVTPGQLAIQTPTCNDFYQPATTFAKIEGRSGLAVKHGIFPIGGIIDSSYRGEIIAIMINFTETPKYIIKAGEKFAQLVFYKALGVDCSFSLEETDELDETDRGEKGFGSSDE